jgi:regulatory protein
MRSEKELSGRLKRKKFDLAIIEEVIEFLKEKRFIDDREFARAWARDKIKRPLGLARISQELKAKGVEKSIIEESLNGIKHNYDEKSVVLGLAQRKIKRLKGVEPRKARSRLYFYLLRRGFSPEIVSDTLNQL